MGGAGGDGLPNLLSLAHSAGLNPPAINLGRLLLFAAAEGRAPAKPDNKIHNSVTPADFVPQAPPLLPTFPHLPPTSPPTTHTRRRQAAAVPRHYVLSV